jgi:hypothetical protein
VKLRVRTAGTAAVQDVRVHVRWRPPGERGLPPRGVRVVHEWREGAADRRFETVCAAAPTRYTVTAGGPVDNVRVTLEPVRGEGAAWRADDPPVVPPPPPAEQVLNPERMRELRRLLRAIDRDPEAGLAEAAASDIEWLSQSARRALKAWQGRPDRNGATRRDADSAPAARP